MGLGALLFLQLALSVYPCVAQSLASDRMTEIAAAAAHESCDGKDQRPTKVCEQHCLQYARAVDMQPQGAPPAPVSPAIRIVTDLDDSLDAARAARHPTVTVVDEIPPLVRFGVLRI